MSCGNGPRAGARIYNSKCTRGKMPGQQFCPRLCPQLNVQCGQDAPSGVFAKRPANTLQTLRKHPQTPASTHKQVATGASAHKHLHKSFLRRPGTVFACPERPGALSRGESCENTTFRAGTLIQQAKPLAQPHKLRVLATGTANSRFHMRFAPAERMDALRGRDWRCAGP